MTFLNATEMTPRVSGYDTRTGRLYPPINLRGPLVDVTKTHVCALA